MHVLIIEFRLTGMDEEGYRAAAAGMAPALAELPGLLAKVWLAGDDGARGGVYAFRDRESMEEYLASDLLASVRAVPGFTGITARGFAVDEGLTRLTQPGLAVVPTVEGVSA
jgi:hypothetical protein